MEGAEIEMKTFVNAMRYLYERTLLLSIVMANAYVLAIILLMALFYPDVLDITDWLYDDEYALNNNLKYYIDFRPGYPPLGKIPIFLIYTLSNRTSFAVLMYNLFTFNISVIVFYYLIKHLVKNKSHVVTIVFLYCINPAVIAALVQSHGDFLALSFTLLSMLFLLKRKVPIAAISMALGFLTKIYTAILLIPAVIVTGKRAFTLMISIFVTTTWLLSTPFLLNDPLMYVSTFVHHLYRGPSESILAILDGYFGHTGFLHPLFDAAIYYYQFTETYHPSPILHFYYAWNNSLLRYISTLLYSIGFLPMCLYVFKRRIKRASTDITRGFLLMVLTGYLLLALSPTQNILTHLPAFTFACILVAPNFNKKRFAIITLYIVSNVVHAWCWSLLYPYVELLLYIISNLRVLLTSLIILTFAEQSRLSEP